MGWRLLQNCSKGETQVELTQFFSVTSDKVTVELKEPQNCLYLLPYRKETQQDDNVPFQRSRQKEGGSEAEALLIHFPTDERMIKVRVNKAVPHSQSPVNAKHSRHLITVPINKVNYLAGLSQTYLLRQSRNPYLTHFLNDSFLNQERY